MRLHPFIFIMKQVFFTGLIALTTSSCSGTYVKDSIAHGVQRGYVEFYFTRGDITWPPEYTHIFNSPSIYMITDDGETYEGRTVSHPSRTGREGRRIAKRPENYTFRVWVPVKDQDQTMYHSPQFGIIDARITVRIKEGYVTPVRILVKGDVKTGYMVTLTEEPMYRLKY